MLCRHTRLLGAYVRVPHLRSHFVWLKLLTGLPVVLTNQMLAEQRRLVLWLPVALALGALFYFHLRQEPSVFYAFGVPALVVGAAAILLWRGWQFVWPRVIGAACMAVSIGFLVAWGATHRQPPMPELPRRGVDVTGTVQAILTFAGRDDAAPARVVVLTGARFETPLDAGMLPLRRTLRLKIRSDDTTKLAPGDEIWSRALFAPPLFPAFPGGRDVQREAWFADSAGSGRALDRIEVLNTGATSEVRIGNEVERLRERLDIRIRTALPDATGTVASTLLTGEATAIPRIVRQDFAASGLSHLLAVAGLHLGLVMTVLMGMARLGFALWEWAALRWPCKALSAGVALAGGVAYAVLTGLHLPVLRSLVMAAVAVLGITVGRRVFSMRGLALAATLLVLMQPQDILGVAFQMSFAAVMALVAGYEVLGAKLARFRAAADGPVHTLLYHGTVLALTSLLAGLATLPVAMAYFGVVQPFFVLANLVAVPLMAVWIMPLGMAALALMPLHMEVFALRPMGWGISLVVHLASCVAHWPAARLAVPFMPGWGLLSVLLGLCWLCLWRQRWRLWGLMAIGAGMASPFFLTQPDILISPDGGMIAVHMNGHLFVNGHSRDAFSIQPAWEQAFARQAEPFPSGTSTPDGSLSCGEERDPDVCIFTKGARSALLRVRDTSDGTVPLPDDVCDGMDVVISTAPLRESCPNAVRLDRFSAWRNGAQAVFLTSGSKKLSRPKNIQDTVTVITDRALRGERPWVMKPGGHGLPNLPLAPSE